MSYPAFKAADVICFHPIRDVSPTSHMYSTSFRLPEAVAFATGSQPRASIEDLPQAAQQAASEEEKVEDLTPSKRKRTE